MDPFDKSHPSLNHRAVKIVAGDQVRWVDWPKLELDERLDLERLLAKAATRRGPIGQENGAPS